MEMTPGPRLSNLMIRWALIGAVLCLGVAGIVIEKAISNLRAPAPMPTHCAVDSGGFPTCPVTYAEVTSHQESHLYYPGSTVFSPFGARQLGSGDGAESAFAGAILTTSASPDAVRHWYKDWTSKNGWTPYAAPGLTTQRITDGYYRGRRESLIVAIDDPASLSRVLGRSVPTGVTVYEIGYHILPYYAPPSATPSPS